MSEMSAVLLGNVRSVATGPKRSVLAARRVQALSARSRYIAIPDTFAYCGCSILIDGAGVQHIGAVRFPLLECS